MMEWVSAIMPFAVAGLAAGAALLGYSHQKRLDRHNDLVNRRREAYSALLRICAKIVTGNSPAVQQEYHVCRADIFLVGSDQVVKATSHLHEKIASDAPTEYSSAEKLDAYAQLVFVMRQDCFERTRLTVDELKKASPISVAE